MSTLRASRPVAVLLLFVLWPTLGLAQSAPPAGIVTQLQGKATIARPVVTQPISLKFKDDVFFRDQVATGERSLVRVLLGGKALVTVRELSTLTFIDEPKRAAVDLKNGKLAVGVAKTLLGHDEEIQVRTPNAIASIRGSLLIVSVVTSGGVSQSFFTALDASVPITVTPIGVTGGSVTLGVNQAVGVSGSGTTTIVGPVQNITPDVARREAQTASASPGGDQTLTSPMAGEISQAKFQQATALATLIAPPPTSTTQPPPPSDSSLTSATQTQLLQESGSTLNATSQTVVSSTPPPPSTASLGVNAASAAQAPETSDGAPAPVPPLPVPPPPVPSVVISGQNLVLGPNDTLKTFTGITNSTDTSPAVTVTNSTVSGPDNLIKVESGANASLAGQLLTVSGPALTPSALLANSSVVDIRGAISSTSANAFISVDPTIFTTVDFLRIVGGSLTVAGPLLTDLQGLYAVAGDFLSISGGGSLTGSSPSTLLQFAGTKIFVGAPSAETASRFFALDGTGSNANLGGSLASLSSGSVLAVNGAAGSAVLELGPGANLMSPSASPVLSLSGSTLSLGAGVKGFLASGGTATVGGALLRASGGSTVLADQTIPFVDLSNATVNVNGALIRLEGGSTLQSGAVKVSGGSLTADSLLSRDGAGNTAAVTGTVLDLSNTAATLRTPEDKPVVDNDTTSLILGLNQPAYRLSSSALTLTGAGERLIKFGASVGPVPTEPGIALIATGTASAPSTINLKGTLLDLAAVNSTATQALVQLDLTTVNQTATSDALISALVPSELTTTMAGPMLTGVSTVINAPGNLFHLAGGSLTSNVMLPFFSFNPSAVNTGQQVVLVDNAALLNLKGALLSAQSTTFKVGDPAINAYSLVNILDGATVASTGTSPLLAFDASSFDGGPILSVRRSPLTSAPSTLTLSGPLFSAVNGSFFDTSSLGLGSTLGTAGGACCSLVSVTQGGQLSSTTTAPLIEMTNSTVKAGPDAQSGGSVFNLSDTFGSAPVTELVARSTVTLAGPLLSATGGALSALFSLLSVARSDFSSSGVDPLIQLNGTMVTLGGFDPIADVPTRGRVLTLFASATTPASLTLLGQGPLFAATNATVSSTDTMFGFFDGSTFSSSTASPLISFSGGSATAGAGALTVASGLGLSPTVSLAGPLLSARNTTLKNGDPTKNAFSFLFIGDSSKFTSTTTAPLLSFDNASLDSSGGVLTLDRSLSTTDPTRLTLSGPLFSAVNQSSFNTSSLGLGAPNACCDTFFIAQGAQLSSTTALPLIQLTNSTLSAGPDLQSGGSVIGIVDTFTTAPPNELVAPAKVTLSGPLLSATGGTMSALFSLLNVRRSSLVSTSTEPLVQLLSTSINLGGTNPFTMSPTFGFLLVENSATGGSNAPTIVSLEGPFLQAVNSTLTTSAAGIGVFNGASLESSTASPFVLLDNTSLTTGAGAGGDFLNVSGLGGPTGTTTSSASFNGPLLLVSNGSDVILQRDVIIGSNNATITGTGSAPFIQVIGGSLTAGPNGAVAGLFNGTKLNLAGPLLSVASTLTAPGGLANISNGGQLTVTGSTDPLVSFSGGSATVAGDSGSSMFNLLSTATAVDAESGLTLGTDRPIQGPLQPDATRPVLTSLLESSGATVAGQRVMNIDTALLEATAPLLNLKAGSVMTSSVDAINLNSRANVSLSGSDLIRLDNSILNVNGGSLVNVNASKLAVGGDLVNLLNGATLTVFNGPLITVSGNGFVNITGSLINFGGTGGNKVNIMNSLCPCSLFGGVPVALQNGALAANVQISNPIKNTTLGQLTLSPTAALAVVNGGGSKLTVKGQ